ncbi:hypothetical protein ASD53_09305 [Lysobacter sp. Root559]|nr:hypothetical protein ASD53_09305 [Lysobacter sp. Root559]
MTSVSAIDAYLALLIAELWLPNLSAQTRQALALSVFVSLKASAFGEGSLATYAQFSVFVSCLHELLPTFPMTDDYVPELDWGQVRVVFESKTHRLMYGGAFERMPDFIEAFRLAGTGGGAGREDMRAALTVHEYLLDNIAQPKEVSGLDSGHLEVPPEEFWAQARQVLQAIPQMTATLAVSPALIARPGAIPPLDAATFTTKFMTGTLLPFAWFELDGKRFPLSPRCLCAVVIQHWEERDGRSSGQLERDTAIQTARFLEARFRPADIIPGPLRVSLRHPKLADLQVGALLSTRKALWVVVLVDVRRTKDLLAAEQRLRALIEEDDGLVAQDLATSQILHMPLQGRSPDAVRVLAVIVAPIAGGASVALPHASNIRTLFLVDLVSIVESVERPQDFDDYFAFVDANEESASPFTGPMDHFAAFRHSHGVLIGGAIRPTMIMLDPHSGSNYRFEELRKFWASAPRRLPDDDPTTWSVKPTDKTLHQLTHRGRPWLSWCADGVEPTLHFMLDVNAQDLEVRHGSLLELFIHCVADAWNERAELFPANLFVHQRVVTHCRANLDHLPDESGGERSAGPLLTAWKIRERNADSLVLEVEVDLSQVAADLEDASDARFETFCASEWLRGACAVMAMPLDEQVLRGLAATADRTPRFTLSHRERTVDVPDHPNPISADLEHFKLARRDLAMEFQAEGISPGRYELKPAKAVIDKIRDRYRTLVHEHVRKFDRQAFVRLAVEQFDHLVAEYDRESTRLRMSLTHEVDFDRTEQQAKAHEEFIRTTRNVRYLLELAYSRGVSGSRVPTVDEWQALVAQADWLLVLYGASDTLHNELEVGGVDVDSEFIPEVFYEGDDDQAYQQEAANELLARGDDQDLVAAMDEAQRQRLDAAFVNSVGFSMATLLPVLAVLGRWVSAKQGAVPLAWSYEGSRADVLATLVAHVPLQVPPAEVEAALDFVTLDPGRVCLLAGQDKETDDVPIWEHRKRVHRYGIRPVLRVGQDRLLWGAAAAHRAFGIWNGTFSDGYPPADFGYPQIEDVAGSIKAHIEQDLELRAVEVFGRHLTYVEHGVDFHRRFRKEGFEDVGDFDVLAYRPEDNWWFMVECKYNKPAFCIKDMRRLREDVFGKTPATGQLAKIARRHAFLETHATRLLELLKWPASAAVEQRIEDLYVCPRIFPFMRRVPRPVLTQFVRLGKLDALVRSRLDGGADPGE